METQKKEPIFELSLLDNGIDFIVKGIDELFDPDLELRWYTYPNEMPATSFKYGILHLFSGFLLLLKERLSRHLEVSIFKGQIKDARQKLKDGKSPNTVDLDEALERLELGPRVVFGESELKTIRRMQNFRNLFEHYKVSLDRYEVWANITDFLVLVDRFLVEELGVALESITDEASLLRKIESIEKVSARVISRKKEEWKTDIEPKAKEFQRRRKQVLDELEREYYEEDSATSAFIECPECSEETLIAEGEFAGVCSNKECNSIHPITSCSKCGQITTGFYWEEPWCDDCKDEFHYYMSKDD